MGTESFEDEDYYLDTEEFENSMDETIGKRPKRTQIRKVSVSDIWKNDDNVTKLIAAVESHACLWNAKNSEYKNRTVRDLAWKAIATEFDNTISVQQLSVKWQHLRNQYRTALVNAKKTKSGQAANKAPQWKFMSQMAFVGSAEINQTAATVSSFNLASRPQSSASSRPQSSASNHPSSSGSIYDELNDNTMSSTPSTSASVSQKKKNTKHSDRSSNEEEQALLSGVQYALGCLQAPLPVEDDVQAFGSFVVSELRKVTNVLQRQSIQREMLKHMWQLIDNVPVNII